MSRPLLVSVISGAERVDTRNETIRHLEAAGLKPAISLSVPTKPNRAWARTEQERLEAAGHRVWVTGNPTRGYGGYNNIQAARAPIQAAHSEGADLLFCEDDIDLAPDFPWFLKQAREATDAVTYFYCHDFKRDKQLGPRYGTRLYEKLQRCIEFKEPFKPKGLYRIRDTSHLNSGQCFYVPWSVLDQLPLEELDRTQSPVDRWSQHRFEKFNIPVLVALPHPVQHRHDRTGRPISANPNKSSISFDLR